MARTASNLNGLKVVKCCASCRHKHIRKDGTRRCTKWGKKVAQMDCCSLWQMATALKRIVIY